MNQQALINAAIGAGLLWAAYKFIPGAVAKTMVLGVAGGFVAKQLGTFVPAVKNYI